MLILSSDQLLDRAPWLNDCLPGMLGQRAGAQLDEVCRVQVVMQILQ